MIEIFRSLRTLLKISHVHIDNYVFRLHYSLTVLILLAFCVLVTTKQYVGEPIDCVRSDSVPQSVINTYCWIHTTYTIPRSLLKKVGIEVPHPGVDNTNDFREFKYHKYYQWISFVLFIQATLFYIPRWLWKFWEGGKIQALAMNLNVAIVNEDEKKQKKELILGYLIASLGHHDGYALRFFFCEILSLINIIGQMFVLDKFFDGEFLKYGLEVIEFAQTDQEQRIDPMTRIFPKVTKCKFYKYGPSANIETVDALCLLPINIINEKIYIILWFWFIFLGLVSIITIFLHILVIICPPLRVYAMHYKYKVVTFDNLNTIVRKCSCGDWFLLYMLGQNIDSVFFKDILEDLSASIVTNKSNNRLN